MSQAIQANNDFVFALAMMASLYLFWRVKTDRQEAYAFLGVMLMLCTMAAALG